MTNLTLWENFGGAYNATATTDLVTAFEKEHPNIKIKIVSQPAGNYFSLLQAAAVSHTGPDLMVTWGGLYDIQDESYIQNLKGLVPSKDLRDLAGMKYVSAGFDTSKGALMVPLENQFYAGFYNKADFRKAGISSPPRTWSQLYTDCGKLKAAGIPNCIVYASGSTNQAATGEFYPWYEMSYLVFGVTPVSKLESLYNGHLPWNSKAITSQLQKWQELHTKGYTNNDPLTARHVMTIFESNQAAMMVKGNWVVAPLTKAMGNNFGAFVPPFSNTPMRGVAEFPGDGYSMTNYSQHKPQAAEFLKFLTTRKAATIIDGDKLIPDLKGYVPSNAVNKQLVQFVAKEGYTQYPLLDNVLQAGIVNEGTTLLPELMAGKITAQSVTQQLEKTWKGLPKNQRGSTFGSYTPS